MDNDCVVPNKFNNPHDSKLYRKCSICKSSTTWNLYRYDDAIEKLEIDINNGIIDKLSKYTRDSIYNGVDYILIIEVLKSFFTLYNISEIDYERCHFIDNIDTLSYDGETLVSTLIKKIGCSNKVLLFLLKSGADPYIENCNLLSLLEKGPDYYDYYGDKDHEILQMYPFVLEFSNKLWICYRTRLA